MTAAQPRCPRCGLALDPLASQPSPDGPVHPACARDEIARARPVSADDALPRMQPMYGGPRPNPSANSQLVWVVLGLLVAAVVVAGGVFWLVAR